MKSDDDLDKLRAQIDALDQELLGILARRMEVVEAIGRYKKAHGLKLRDEERLRALLSAQLSRSETLHLPPEFISELYTLIHKFALRRENEV